MSAQRRLSVETLHEYVEEVGSCWHWTRCISELGYGVAWFRRRKGKAHRAVYQLLIGEIPTGLTLDHLCRVRHCVNPDHLEPVTQRENLRRSPLWGSGPSRRPTHCKNGHEFSGSNVYVRPSRPTRRECRACNKQRNAALYQALSQTAA